MSAGGGPGDEPDREGGDRDGDDGGHEVAGDRVGEPLDRRLGGLGLLHQLMIWASIVSAPTFSARTRSDPVALMVAPMTVSPARLVTGIGSPVTIDSSTADDPGQDDGVDRDLLSGPDHDLVADHHLLDRDLGLGAVADDPGGAGLQAEQLADGLAGAGLGPGLEQPAEQDQREDHPDRLEVDLRARRPGSSAGRDGDQQAVAVGGRRCPA